MARTTNDQKRDYGFLLYTRERLTQKEASEKCGVTANTFGRWVKQGDWEKMRNGYSVTKEEQLRQTYASMTELNEVISEREKGLRYPNSKEADTLLKLAQTAKALETEASLDEIINSFTSFLQWLRSIDLKEAQKIAEYQDAFIKYKLNVE